MPDPLRNVAALETPEQRAARIKKRSSGSDAGKGVISSLPTDRPLSLFEFLGAANIDPRQDIPIRLRNQYIELYQKYLGDFHRSQLALNRDQKNNLAALQRTLIQNAGRRENPRDSVGKTLDAVNKFLTAMGKAENNMSPEAAQKLSEKLALLIQNDPGVSETLGAAIGAIVKGTAEDSGSTDPNDPFGFNNQSSAPQMAGSMPFNIPKRTKTSPFAFPGVGDPSRFEATPSLKQQNPDLFNKPAQGSTSGISPGNNGKTSSFSLSPKSKASFEGLTDFRIDRAGNIIGRDPKTKEFKFLFEQTRKKKK